ncbi:MAG: DUF1902 domain-containing protein, partial [Deltaproteobacteria bacterium]
SNVPGLVGEAATLEAMMALLQVRVPEMLEENGGPGARVLKQAGLPR